MKAVDNSELARFRQMSALHVLEALSDYVKLDVTFTPSQASTTQRVYLSAAGGDWELLLNGPRFFDKRTGLGGGGAVDLVMYLWKVPFRKAITILRTAKI